MKLSNDYWRGDNDYVTIIEVDSPSPKRKLFIAKSRKGTISKRPQTLLNANSDAILYMRNHP